MGSANEQLAEEMAKLLFQIFIYIADTDKNITPHEVECFNRLIEDAKWTENVELRLASKRLCSEYTSMWTAYEAKEISINLEIITEQLNRACNSLTRENANALRSSLNDFVIKIGQSGPSILLKRRPSPGEELKRKARGEIQLLLDPPRRRSPIENAQALLAVSTANEPPRINLSIVPATSVSNRGVWPGGRTQMKCVNVVPETHDVKTYTFVSDPPYAFQYLPGQFLTVDLLIDEKVVRRSYTISSSPSRPHTISITVKRTPNGYVSNWLYENMRQDFELHVNGPHGDFTCLNHPSNKLLLISAGSGITPMMSMLRWLSDTSASVDIVFINNVRTPADVIFSKELEHISTRWRNPLKLAVIPSAVPQGQAWNGLTGPMSEQMLQTVAPDFQERETFVCGPPGYMDMVRNMLAQMGFPMARYHQESFGGAATPKKSNSVSDRPAPTDALSSNDEGKTTQGSMRYSPNTNPDRSNAITAPNSLVATKKTIPEKGTIEIVFQKSQKTVACSNGDFILDVAEKNGIFLNSSCRAGNCGTCKVKKIKGSVEMNGQQALTETEIADGYILTCIGQGTGQVIIDA